MASRLSVSMTKRDSCVLARRWHCLPWAGDQVLGGCTIPALQRALLASPPATKQDKSSALGLGGVLPHPSLAAFREPFRRACCPAPHAEPSSPLAPFSSGRGGGCGALWIMSSQCLSSPHPEPSVGASLCREVWEPSLLRGSWAKANSQLDQRVQESSQLLPRCIRTGSWGHVSSTEPEFAPSCEHHWSGHPPRPAQMCRCSRAICSEVPPGSSKHLGTSTVGCHEQAHPTQGKFGTWHPSNVLWSWQSSSGWAGSCADAVVQQTGSSDRRQSLPVSPAGFDTARGRVQPRT